jgi:hypothetical protein
MSPKLFNVYLGYEPVGRSAGYTTRAEAVKAARRIAREHGSMPYEVRTVSHTDRETGRPIPPRQHRSTDRREPAP